MPRFLCEMGSLRVGTHLRMERSVNAKQISAIAATGFIAICQPVSVLSAAESELPTQSQAVATTKPCIGVVVETQNGPANLLGFRVNGDSAAVEKVVAAAKQIGSDVGNSQRQPDGRVEVYFFFPSPPVTSAAAVSVIKQAQSGDFGSLTVETKTFGIETLPADKCPRS